MNNIDISVIMPAWKSEAFIAKAIASVQAQQGVAFELIIVDDASPDDTRLAIESAAAGDDRIIYDRLPKNMGPSGARNRAIELARGDFIAVLDDDDLIAPTRLATMLAAARTHNADIIVDNMRPIYPPATEPTAERFLDIPLDAPARQITLRDYIDPETEAELGQGLGYLKPLFRKATLDRLELRYDEALRNSEDFYLVAEMLALDCNMVLIPEADYFYTIRTGSLSYRLSTAYAAAIVSAERSFRTRFAKGFDAPTARASRRQLKQRLDYLAFAKLVDALKGKNPIALVKVAASHPRSIPYMLANLIGIAARKLR